MISVNRLYLRWCKNARCVSHQKEFRGFTVTSLERAKSCPPPYTWPCEVGLQNGAGFPEELHAFFSGFCIHFSGSQWEDGGVLVLSYFTLLLSDDPVCAKQGRWLGERTYFSTILPSLSWQYFNGISARTRIPGILTLPCLPLIKSPILCAF